MATGLFALTAAVVTTTALAAAGGLDPSFSDDGKRTFGFANGTGTDSGFDMAIQPNGKIVVAGYSDQSAGAGYDFAAARLHPRGGLDQSFRDGGRRTFGFANGANDFGSAMAITPNGKIVIVGSTDSGGDYDVAVAQLNADGNLDGSFSSDGKRTLAFGGSDDEPYDVAIQPNGKIVVVGYSTKASTGEDFAVARLNPNGSLDTTFGGDGKRTFGFGTAANPDLGDHDEADGVAIQPDGKIVLVGFSRRGGPADFAVARLNPGGGSDQGFSGDGRRTLGFANGSEDDFGYDVGIQPNGKIVIVGRSDQDPGPGSNVDFAVARLRAGGGLDQGFGDAGRRTVTFPNGTGFDIGSGVAIQPNGSIVVSGQSAQSGSSDDFAVARLRANGNLDGSFSSDGRRTFGFGNGFRNDSADGLAIQANGRIVVAGSSNQLATGDDFAVARLLGS